MDLLQLSALIIILAFVCEYMDSSLGMGYGTALTPLLIIMEYDPPQIVPAILLSELFTGLTAGFVHHQARNVNFKFGSRDLKIAMVMAVCSIFGSVVAVLLAVRLPSFWVKLYIGVLVSFMGAIILVFAGRTFRFSWNKITCLGFLAAFNKGMSGGGYGPLVTSGQILAGVNSKSAIGITSLAEGLTCLVGVGAYLALANHTVEWSLAPSLVVGAMLSVPFAAFTVKKFNPKGLKVIVGVATLILGLLTLVKIVF